MYTLGARRAKIWKNLFKTGSKNGPEHTLVVQTKLLLGIAVLSSICSAIPSWADSVSSQRLPVSPPVLKSTGKVTEDAVYRYLADKGAQYFRKGRFAEAEKFFQAALANAKLEGVHDRRMAMLLTNLATDLREEQKYSEAEPLFERAVELEKAMPTQDKPLMLYTARQYAGLLRQTDRDETADSILASARTGFENLHLAPDNFTLGQAESERTASGVDADDESEKLRERRLAERAARPNFEPLPVLRTEVSVTAQLKDLADIERSYAQQSQTYFPQSTYSFATPFTFSPPFAMPITPGFVPSLQYSHGGGMHSGGHSFNYGRAGSFRSH
jgi:tetratricopeptide (TPR) repeat protein